MNDSQYEAEMKLLCKAVDIMFGRELPKSTRSLPRHEIDMLDVELQWFNGRGEIARVLLMFRGNEFDITDAVRTNRDGSLTTIVEELFEEVAELRREDVEDEDMSDSQQGRKAS